MARLLYAGLPACELRDLVSPLAHMDARTGPVYRISLTHVFPDKIRRTRLFDTRFAGWDLYNKAALGHIFGRRESIGPAGSKSFLTLLSTRSA